MLTPPDCLYLDHPYEADFEERGLYWAAEYTDNRKIFEYSPTEHIGNSSGEILDNLLGKLDEMRTTIRETNSVKEILKTRASQDHLLQGKKEEFWDKYERTRDISTIKKNFDKKINS